MTHQNSLYFKFQVFITRSSYECVLGLLLFVLPFANPQGILVSHCMVISSSEFNPIGCLVPIERMYLASIILNLFSLSPPLFRFSILSITKNYNKFIYIINGIKVVHVSKKSGCPRKETQTYYMSPKAQWRTTPKLMKKKEMLKGCAHRKTSWFKCRIKVI